MRAIPAGEEHLGERTPSICAFHRVLKHRFWSCVLGDQILISELQLHKTEIVGYIVGCFKTHI
jgi:hypothetical protein